MSDVEGIHKLIDDASRTTTVLPRTRDSICESLRDYTIAVNSSRIIGCAALHIWGVDLAEVRSVVVDREYRGQGIGAKMIGDLIQSAKRLDLVRLFVLTDEVRFFEKLGFSETERGTLPHKIWNECILCPKFEDCGEVSLGMRLDKA